MAEAFAVVGIVASIIQLVDFSSKVLRRLEEFQTNLGEIPESFRHIAAELPLLQDTLQRIGAAIEAGLIGDATKKALVPVITGCKEQIELLDQILAKTVATLEDSKLEKLKKAISSVRNDPKVERITRILRNFIGTLSFYYASVSSTLQPLTDAKLTKIRQWLAPPDPSINYQRALKLRQDGTGLWLLSSDAYTAWKTDPASFIWLHGIPGCGKTILSSTVLQNILENYTNDDVGKVVAYFYFTFNEKEKQSPESMVRSLISQFSRQCVAIPTSLNNLFTSCGNGYQQPSLDALLEVLRSLIQEFPQSYIVLDALDECVGRPELMEILEGVAGWNLDGLHVLVTSRREYDIARSLDSIVATQSIICLESDVVDLDILTYVRQRLFDDKDLKKWHKNPQTRDQIETALKNGAHGMFRWAQCQMDTLGECRNQSMLRKALDSLPPTLDETYDRILCAIRDTDSEIASRILQWLAFAARPLLVEEIAEVAALDVERRPAFDRDEVLEDPSEALIICSSLVTITTAEEDGQIKKVIALAHYSVKEYLTSARILQGRTVRYCIQDVACNEYIAKGCLNYLLQFQTLDSLPEETLQDYKLAFYAAEYWITHTKAAALGTEALTDLIMELFSKGNAAYQNWIRLYNPDTPWDLSILYGNLTHVPAPLYYASLKALWEEDMGPRL